MAAEIGTFNRNLDSSEVVNYVRKQLKEKEIVFETDQEKYKSFVMEHRLKNFSDIIIPDLTVQFLGVLDSTFDKVGNNFYLLTYLFLCYTHEGQKYTLDYYDHMVYLHYHKNCPKSKVDEQVEFWKWLFSKARDKQSERVHGMFLNNRASIFNYYNSDIRGLNEQAKRIIETISNSPSSDGYNALSELYSPRKAYRGLYEIRNYILGVFSFLEYVSNCLLPFWEADDKDDWHVFLRECRAVNSLIKTWTDLFDERKVAYTHRIEDNVDIRKPAQITIVNLFFKTIGAVHPEYQSLSDEFFSLKKTYRNVVAHGAIGYDFYDAITPNIPSIMTDKTEVSIFESLINVDYHAFYRVDDFFQNFLTMLENLFPIAVQYLETAMDIPTDMREYVSIANGEKDRARAYLEVLQVSSDFSHVKHVLGNGMSSPSASGLREFLKFILESYGFSIDDDNPLEPDYVFGLIVPYVSERLKFLGQLSQNGEEGNR